MLAELFNVLVSKLFVNEYRDLAEFYLAQYRRATDEKNQLAQQSSAHHTRIKHLERDLTAALNDVQELRATAKTAVQSNQYGDEQKQLLNAAMMNIATKEMILKLQTDLRCKSAELERCHKAGANEKAFHDIVAKERDELLAWKTNAHKAAVAVLNTVEYNGFLYTISDEEFEVLAALFRDV